MYALAVSDFRYVLDINSNITAKNPRIKHEMLQKRLGLFYVDRIIKDAVLDALPGKEQGPLIGLISIVRKKNLRRHEHIVAATLFSFTKIKCVFSPSKELASSENIFPNFMFFSVTYDRGKKIGKLS